MEALDGLFDEAVAEFRRRLVGVVSDMRSARDPEAFCRAERALVALSQKVASDVTERVVQDVSDDKMRRREAFAEVRARAAERGIEMRNERDRQTEFRTLGGRTVEVTTPYATARPRAGVTREKRGAQGTGVYPVLDQLGINGRCTPALRLLVARTVCEANSVTSARDLLGSGGININVDHKAALRLTYSVCDDALRARREAIRATVVGAEAGPFVGRRVVAAVDGGRVNTRKRVAGRPKKGGRKHFETDWREPKVLTIYVLGPDGRRDRKVPSVIDGTLGDADAVFELLTYHLLRLGGCHAAELVLIGDGAPWIWNRAAALRERLGLAPTAFREVVDYFHVVERLGEMSKTQTHWSEDTQRGWLKVQKERLKAGKIEEIEAVVRVIAKRLPEVMKKDIDYWSRNRERMRYADLRAHTVPIGSGAVESSVRRVINLRMKGASIFWTEEHAEGVLHLRAHAKSGRWGELEVAALNHARWRPTARAGRQAP
jgi:hypothetical protein